MYKNIQECILHPKDVYFGGLASRNLFIDDNLKIECYPKLCLIKWVFYNRKRVEVEVKKKWGVVL